MLDSFAKALDSNQKDFTNQSFTENEGEMVQIHCDRMW